ncbi:MAG: molybdate ABC transporter permease subunit [Bacillota bacterium]|nr:molybdate ABC transporter permease subunit [Bacillota bacterium]
MFDPSPILISMKTAFTAIFITFFLGIFCARAVEALRRPWLQMLLDGLLTLPMVLPPTVAGFFLLYIFGVQRPIGAFLIDFFAYRIAFSWSATVLAAVVISFPLMYRSARAAFAQVDSDLLQAAATLGMPRRRIFWRITLPLSLPGVAAGGVLAFARGLGEFGATAMIAGNIAGKTRTLPLAVYSEVAGGDMAGAYRYVAILVAICLVVIVAMNYFTNKEQKYKAGIGR